MILVTGGAGFIGSNFVWDWIKVQKSALINLDQLTYAGNRNNLTGLLDHDQHRLVQGSIGDRELVREILHQHQPQAIINFAAETHVDRSIHSPADFVQTNILGGFSLLEESYLFWKGLSAEKKAAFRFINISTDEVFGSLTPQDPLTNEKSAYLPSSPYAASKASFDHLVRSFYHTYGFPALTTFSSNNFGPFQFPEKLIPLMIVHALQGKALPIYGDGNQRRQWIYVKDHCEAIRVVLAKGKPGETYNIGHETGFTNLEVVTMLCELLDELATDSDYRPHSQLIQHVKDRLGHDRRYALDCTKIQQELGWHPKETFKEQLRQTVKWYLENEAWLADILSGEYRLWIAKQYS